MIKQLRTIASNFIKAAALLEKIPSTDTGIQNVILENAYQINQLEIYSDSLKENILLTSKLDEHQIESDKKDFKNDVENLNKILSEEFLTPTNRIMLRELIEKLNKL